MVKVLLVVLLFAALAGGSAYLTIMLIVKGEKRVIVPDLAGRDLVYALQLLGGLGLNTRVTDAAHHDTVPPNHIVFQKPAPGTEVKSGRDVRVVISKGPLRAVVPDLGGFRIERARALLTDGGHCVGNLSQWHTADYPSGQVVSQWPPPGTSVLRKDCVSLLVSRGSARQGRVMPDVTGMDAPDAMLKAEQAGLSVTDIRYERRPDLPLGRVLEQRPPAGYRTVPGDRVSVVINGRHAGASALSAGRTGVIRHRLAPGFLRQHVLLQLRIAGTAVDVYDEYVAPDTELWFMVPVTAGITARLYVDDVPVDTPPPH